MYLAKPLLVIRDNAEGKVTVRLAKSPILVADGLPHPGPFLKFSPREACRAALELLWGSLRAFLGKFDPAEEPAPSSTYGAGIQGGQVALMMRNLYSSLGIPYSWRMPIVAQQWRVAEELRKDLKTCDVDLRPGFERLIDQLEQNDRPQGPYLLQPQAVDYVVGLTGAAGEGAGAGRLNVPPSVVKDLFPESDQERRRLALEADTRFAERVKRDNIPSCVTCGKVMTWNRSKGWVCDQPHASDNEVTK